MKPVTLQQLDDAYLLAGLKRCPVIYTLKPTDLPESDLRLADKQVCVYPDGQLDVIGHA